MFAIQAAIALLGPKDNDFEPKINSIRDRSFALVAKVATAVGIVAQAFADRPYAGPRDDESHAEMLLRMITGNESHPEGHVDVMNQLLTLQADHSAGNAGTFTSRVVTSTKAEPEAVVSAAIGALSGPAHGGATDGSLRLFMEIGDPNKAESEIGKRLDDSSKLELSYTDNSQENVGFAGLPMDIVYSYTDIYNLKYHGASPIGP